MKKIIFTLMAMLFSTMCYCQNDTYKVTSIGKKKIGDFSSVESFREYVEKKQLGGTYIIPSLETVVYTINGGIYKEEFIPNGLWKSDKGIEVLFKEDTITFLGKDNREVNYIRSEDGYAKYRFDVYYKGTKNVSDFREEKEKAHFITIEKFDNNRIILILQQAISSVKLKYRLTRVEVDNLDDIEQ